MKCFDPVLCFTIDKRTVYRNWSFAKDSVLLRGIAPRLVFSCGRCLHCRRRRSVELAARCVLHASCYRQNMFVTLTYDESREGYHNVLDYADIQKFKKRLRSYVSRRYSGRKIEIFNVHEYGKNGKKHWHLIVFGFDFEDKEIFSRKDQSSLFVSRDLQVLWPAGFSTVGDVSEASAMYQAQYMEKDFRNGNITSERRSTSRHNGIGKPFFLQNYKQILSLGFIPFSGRKMPLPRYFEKLAQKHYAHFYDQSLFFDTPERKARFRPFKAGEENKDIADLFGQYIVEKQMRIMELEREFEEVVDRYFKDKDDPDFVLSGFNSEYDFRKKIQQERF